MKSHKQDAASARWHRSWESRPQFLFAFTPHLFYLSSEQSGFFHQFCSLVENRNKLWVYPFHCYWEKVQAKDQIIKPKSQDSSYCPFYSCSHVFMKTGTICFISFCLTPNIELSETWFVYVTLDLGNVTWKGQNWLLNMARRGHLQVFCELWGRETPQGAGMLPAASGCEHASWLF